jgi:hypothetical protein
VISIAAMQRLLPFFAFSLLLTTNIVTAAPARAANESEPPRHFGGQRTFGFGPTVGFYSGAGAMVGVGETLGLWLSGGYMPILITGTEGNGIKYDFYNSAQANADLALTPWHPTFRSSIGMIAGYKYNTVLGHGGSAGITFSYDLNRLLALRALAGISIFPDAADHLRSDHGYPSYRDPALPWFQGGINLGLAIHP